MMANVAGRVIYGSRIRYFIGEKEVTEKVFRKRFAAKQVDGEPGAAVAAPGIWPLESAALAVHPKQVEQANARAKLHGIAVVYKPDGTCVIADRAARRKLNRLEGFFDKRGGYGD